MKIYLAETESPIGKLYLASSARGLVQINLNSKEELLALTQKMIPDAEFEENQEQNQAVLRQLREYFTGKRRQFDIPLHLVGTDFHCRVWQELQKIPFGTTASYKEIAIRIGKANAVRAVGQANHHNPIPIIIPCHRVIGNNGKLVGFGGGLPMKQQLLAHEGIFKAI